MLAVLENVVNILGKTDFFIFAENEHTLFHANSLMACINIHYIV